MERNDENFDIEEIKKLKEEMLRVKLFENQKNKSRILKELKNKNTGEDKNG